MNLALAMEIDKRLKDAPENYSDVFFRYMPSFDLLASTHKIEAAATSAVLNDDP